MPKFLYKYKIIFTSFSIGFILAGFMMYVAWNHNAQGEIHIGGSVDWGYWLLIGLSWFIPAFFVTFIIILLLSFIISNNKDL